MLTEIISGKVLQRSYGHIKHLPGSKMIDAEDKLLGQNEIDLLTKRRKDPADIVIVTEKIDGMNACVYRKGDSLFALGRKGYDVRTNPNAWIRSFADYVDDNYNRFMELLNDGERICGEWMIKTHTVEYDIRTEPFIAFDLINKDNERASYMNFRMRCNLFNIPTTGLVHIGESISPQMALEIMGAGYHRAADQPEGVVYKYESAENGFYCSGKYVSHPNIGKDEYFHAEDDNSYNKIKSKYKIYIPKYGGV